MEKNRFTELMQEFRWLGDRYGQVDDRRERWALLEAMHLILARIDREIEREAASAIAGMGMAATSLPKSTYTNLPIAK